MHFPITCAAHATANAFGAEGLKTFSQSLIILLEWQQVTFMCLCVCDSCGRAHHVFRLSVNLPIRTLLMNAISQECLEGISVLKFGTNVHLALITFWCSKVKSQGHCGLSWCLEQLAEASLWYFTWPTDGSLKHSLWLVNTFCYFFLASC